jgi:hypothetical protein
VSAYIMLDGRMPPMAFLPEMRTVTPSTIELNVLCRERESRQQIKTWETGKDQVIVNPARCVPAGVNDKARNRLPIFQPDGMRVHSIYQVLGRSLLEMVIDVRLQTYYRGRLIFWHMRLPDCQ